MDIRKIEKDFEELKRDVFAILLFGSRAKDEATERSDIDICLIVKDGNLKKVWDKILESRITEKYDVKIFELLPLKLKGEIIENHRLIWTKSKPELYYYLYKWRKVWEDQKIARKKLGMKLFY